MYKSINEVLKEKYGCKVYKIALSTGCTCPNRDGTIGVGGCIFCGNSGSGDFAEDKNLSIGEQINRGKERVSKKLKEGKYIAYFQSFTNTYNTVAYLEPLFMEAIQDPDVVALSIATRPDCIPSDILEMLKRLIQIKPVWVELGLQTIHKESAKFIRRGYELPVYDDAVKRLKEAGIEVIVHVILGLPGETKQMMLDTVSYVVESKADGIKLQLLHVLKNTDLACFYEQGRFEVLTEEQYIDCLASCVELIPESVAIHRLTGDGKRSELIAPLWSTDKKHILNSIHKELRLRGQMK